MKTLLILFLSVIVFFSCSTVDEDCLCTEEYRFFLVTIVDTLGVPVDSLNVTIRDKDRDELNVAQDPHPFGASTYTILNDSFTQMFCSCTTPEKFTFQQRMEIELSQENICLTQINADVISIKFQDRILWY